MATEIWLALVAALLSVIGCLGAWAVTVILTRIGALEKKHTKLLAAVLTLLVSKENPDLARALHGLLIGAPDGGIGSAGGDD